MEPRAAAKFLAIHRWPGADCFSLGGLVWFRPGDFLGLSGSWLMIIGGILTAFTVMGWAHQIIKEKVIAHDLSQQQLDLKMFIKCFLVSEFMVFFCIFFYYYAQKIINPDFHAPEGLHLGGKIAVFATALLLTSSVTCEFAHHAVMHKQKGKARALLLSTLVLGATFLMFQGYEYGLLFEFGYTPTALEQIRVLRRTVLISMLLPVSMVCTWRWVW